MEFEEMRAIWREVGPDGHPGNVFERQILRGLGVDRLRSSLSRFRSSLWYEVVAGFVIAFLTGGYLAAHIGTLRFAVPALLLHAAAIAVIVMPIRQLLALSRIDYGQPVVAIQKQLGALRVSRVRGEAWVLILAPLLWTPMAITGAHALFGIDIYQGFGMPWVFANLAFGLAVLGAAIWASRRYGDRIGNSRVWRSVADGLAGRSLAAAHGFLVDLEAFETED